MSDSQSARGAQGRRMKFFWRVCVVLVCAAVGFLGFSFYALLHDDGLYVASQRHQVLEELP